MGEALRKLEALHFAYRPVPSPNIGTPGALKWLPLDELLIDTEYQRAILESGKANIRRMIEDFSWFLFGVLVVGRRGLSRFAIIDGQHRATAAKLHGGIAEVPCLVLQGGMEAEARAFAAINGNRTRINPLQSFRAAVAAKEPTATGIVKLCARANITIAPYPKVDLLAGETMGLGAVTSSLKRYGEIPLVAGMKLIRAMEPGAGIPADAIRGATTCLRSHPDWVKDAERLGAEVGRGITLAKLVAAAQQRRMTYGGTVWMSFDALLTQRITASQRSAPGVSMARLMAGR